jgi:hypothetical protein
MMNNHYPDLNNTENCQEMLNNHELSLILISCYPPILVTVIIYTEV